MSDQAAAGMDAAGRADRHAATRLYFEGDTALYAAFEAAFAAQCIADGRRGDAASAAGDLHDLRRLAHDLRVVLLVLGLQQVRQLATTMEDAALAGNLLATRTAWFSLRDAISSTNAAFRLSAPQ